MADVLTYWPNSTLAYRTFYRDSVWSAAVGDSIFHGAPVMVAKSTVGEVTYDFEDFFDYSTSNYTNSDSITSPYNGGTAALSTTQPGGVLELTSIAGEIDTGIQRNFSFPIVQGQNLTIWHETQLALASATVGEFFVGLATVGDEPILHIPDIYFAFYKRSYTNVIESRIKPGSNLSPQHAGGLNFNYPLSSATMTRFAIILTTASASIEAAFYINGVPHSAFITERSEEFNGTTLQWICSITGNVAESATQTASIDYHNTLQGPPP